MVEWANLPVIPDSLKASAETLRYAGGREWRQEVDGGWVNLVTASGQSVEVDLGIGTGWNTNVFSQIIPIVKAQGVADLFSIVVPIFCLETFGNHGGRFYITPSHDCDIYGKAIFIQRTFAP